MKLSGIFNRHGYHRVTGRLARKSFSFFEKAFGVHVTPANFYSPVPILSELDQDVYNKIYLETGLKWRELNQLRYLNEVFPKYVSEYQPQANSGLSLVDALALYAMIREKKPKQMIEVGAGDTTHIAMKALEKNRSEGFDFKFISVEPYPRADILKIKNENFRLIHQKLQSVDIAVFKDTDLLFIDSSHVSKIGSDVNYEILEILPALKVGALIHFHDIPFPQNYWKDWMQTATMFWNESYLLHAFLLFNTSFEIVWASNYMRLNHYERLTQRFSYLTRGHRLSSFWIERVN